MMKNKTYRNFMIICKRIQAKGYTFKEAEQMTHRIFDQFENFPMGLSIEEMERRIITKNEWEEMERRGA